MNALTKLSTKTLETLLVRFEKSGEINTVEKIILELTAREQPKKTKQVRNLMSGKMIEIDADTPFCCDPSTETYWSM
jgi:hypothetical protein